MIRLLIPKTLENIQPALIAEMQQLQGNTMGTTWQVKWVHERREGADKALVQELVEKELDRVIEQMSTWKEDSVLCKFNRAPAGMRTTLPREFREVLHAAVTLADITGGAFNPAAGRLVNLWGFGPSPRYTEPDFCPPDLAQIAHALQSSDWSELHVEEGVASVVQPGGVWLDFSAIAKGYAVDRVVEKLIEAGLPHVMVEVGGEFRGHGLCPGGLPWWVDLENPPTSVAGPALPLNRLALHGVAVATSGDYRRSYMHRGKLCSHSIDPRDGLPIQHGLASVSVIHKSCMWADGWATALNILGVHTAHALAQQHGLAARFVERMPDGQLVETSTPAFQELME